LAEIYICVHCVDKWNSGVSLKIIGECRYKTQRDNVKGIRNTYTVNLQTACTAQE